MFATGDRVVYPLHGGAIIKEIEQREQDGANKTRVTRPRVTRFFITFQQSFRHSR